METFLKSAHTQNTQNYNMELGPLHQQSCISAALPLLPLRWSLSLTSLLLTHCTPSQR